MKEPTDSIRINSKHDWKDKLYVIIFRSTTPLGKKFDLWLLIAIVISVLIVLADSVPAVHARHGEILYVLEWVFTLLFTIEYILRIIIVERKAKYIFSVIGLIDLIAIIPTYLSIFLVGYQFLIVFRSLRLLRIFKILQLKNFQHAGAYISSALYNSYRKILIFLMFITLLVVIIGSIMYIIEDDTPGFESIPNSIYWAVVTITTVGYGDVSPLTPLGKFLSIMVMLCGYSIIAVPTGIVTMEMVRTRDRSALPTESCPRCGQKDHPAHARYCFTCGERLQSTPKT